MSEHTPGPWKQMRFDESQRCIIPDRDDDRQPLICIVSMGEKRPDGEANARLIAAAPAQHEALHQVLECLAYRGDETKEQLLGFIQDAQDEARAAIALASPHESEAANVRPCECCGEELEPDVGLCPTCNRGDPYFATMRSET